MGEVEIRIARQFLGDIGVVEPLTADEAAHAAGFLLVPSEGATRVDGNIVRYDERHPTWERDLWELVSARLLTRAGLPDRASSRAIVARALGATSSLSECA